MVSRDYTKEVGLPTSEKRVPKAVGYAIILIVAAGCWYAIQTWGLTSKHHKPAEPSTAAAHK